MSRLALRRIGFARRPLALALAGILAVPLLGGHAVRAADLPAGFQETTVLSGLLNPTAVRFAPDGRIFVAEKRGVIKVFDGIGDTTAVTFADLRSEVHNFWDRGLLGLALHPGFPTIPYVYALYTYDAEPGGTHPRWGTPNTDSDPCPSPPGATADGCVVTGRLTRLTASGDSASQITPLVTDWCQQYPSHSIGDLAFGADGALYVSAGDGASFNFTDYGQRGSPVNPCGDPPGGVGGSMTAPTAEGGALRSQDLRTPADPTTLDGAILRLDPLTGGALSSNPLASSNDQNARRIVAYGLRNPFRITVRPGTSEVWAGDVGWSTFEEINRLASPTSGVVNFGWPCYEGSGRQGGYDGADLTVCENLYSQGGATNPYFSYRHGQAVSNEACATGNGSSTAGLAFYQGSAGSYPAQYDGALFFADYSRKCIWVMYRGANGLPDPATRTTFRNNAASPVSLVIGPGGDLYYPDFNGGSIRRISYSGGNQSPVASVSASPTEGVAPLTVNFDASRSSDPDGNPLTFRWDLDGDGVFNDGVGTTASRTYTATGSHTARVEVSDGRGGLSAAAVTISVGGTSPTPVIESPSASTLWRVGDTISFRGSATDFQDGTLPASALTWSLILHHCPTDASSCHEHPLQSWSGAAGSFVAPDHDYPSHLELRLSARDSDGFTTTISRILQPRTVVLTFATKPRGLSLVVGGSEAAVAPFSKTFIVGSRFTVSAPATQTLGSKTYVFASWSDKGVRTHEIVAPATKKTYTASYATTR